MATSKPDDKIFEEEEGGEESVELHGVINPQEASRHVLSLNKTLNIMENRIKVGEEKDVLKDAVGQSKNVISLTVPQITNTDIAKVAHMPGTMPRTEERDELLELVMPLEDAPGEEEVFTLIEKDAPLTDSPAKSINRSV